MADQDHVDRLIKESVRDWNEWKRQNRGIRVDLSHARLSPTILSEVNLSGANLQGTKLDNANLIDADLHDANLADASLEGAKLFRANLCGANLSRANLIRAGMSDADLSGAVLNDANIREAILSHATLRGAELRNVNLVDSHLQAADLRSAILTDAALNSANLVHADLRGINLSGTNLRSADLREADIQDADLSETNLSGANLRFAKLRRAKFYRADLRTARLDNADLRDADLTGAAMFRAALTSADLTGAILTGADLRAATLLQATLNECIANDVMLWESQRSGWKIAGIVCKRAFWDKDAQTPTLYEPGEFEKLHSDQACIELFYEGGVSKFELNTLPALLHHLASLHKDSNIRLKSIEETGGGAKISISVGESDTEVVEKIKSDAIQVHRAQLALRDNEILRLDTEKKYLESFVSEKLIKAMLTATTPQNVFNAPVYGVAFASGNGRVEMQQTINDNSAILALLEKIMERREDLSLGDADASLLEAEVYSAKAELEKNDPSPSLLSRSLKFVQKMAAEAVTKAAGKLGEQAVSADWPSLLHQLNQFVVHLK